MGAINNAFNQAAGAVAGAALAIQHAKETDFSKMNSADSSARIAIDQARAANNEADAAFDEAAKKGGLLSQLSEAEVNREEAEKAYNKAVNRKNGSPTTRLKKFTELEAAKKAEYELNIKYQSIMGLHHRAEDQLNYAEKATQMALDAKEKYEKHWGGAK